MSNSATPAQPDEPQRPGALLAAARQARRMTVAEVASRLKFSARQFEALEADRYDALPDPSIVRGMIRNYARLVGIDPGPVLDALRQHLNAGPVTMLPDRIEVPFPRVTRRGSFVYVLLSAIVVIAVVSVIVEWVLRPGTPDVAAAGQRAPLLRAPEPVATPAPAPVPTQIALPEQRRPAVVQQETVLSVKRIELVFDRESWVEIKDADGRVVFSQLNPPGTRRNVVGEAPFALVIGAASGVKLRYNDSDVDLGPFTRTDVARLTLK